jgi:hypothetical protein
VRHHRASGKNNRPVRFEGEANWTGTGWKVDWHRKPLAVKVRRMKNHCSSSTTVLGIVPPPMSLWYTVDSEMPIWPDLDDLAEIFAVMLAGNGAYTTDSIRSRSLKLRLLDTGETWRLARVPASATRTGIAHAAAGSLRIPTGRW